MFYDLNIPRPSTSAEEKLFDNILATLAKLGYRSIAVTTNITDASAQKKSIFINAIPLPYQPSKTCGLKVYNRINVEVSDAMSFHKMQNSKSIKLYDLISIDPENQNVLKALSSWNDFDILAYNPVNKPSINFNRKVYNKLVQNGIFIELVYAPIVSDASCRKNLIKISHIYHSVGRSKHIIISSQAPTASFLRSPYDIINLSLLFGLSEEQAKYAVSKTCEKLLLKARTRRHGRSIIEMIPLEEDEIVICEDS